MSCTLHDVQLPQSASASITTSHLRGDLVAQVDRRRLGERRLLEAQRRWRRSSVSRCSRRSRNTSPRGLEMSSSPTVLPCERGGPRQQRPLQHGALAGRIEQQPGHGTTLPGDRAGMPVAPLAQPPIMAENKPGATTGVARAAGRRGGTCRGFRPPATRARLRPCRRRRERCSAPGICRRACSSRQQSFAVPAGLGEDPPVLGPDDEHAVESDHELGVVRGAQARGERVGQLIGVACQLVDDARVDPRRRTR